MNEYRECLKLRERFDIPKKKGTAVDLEQLLGRKTAQYETLLGEYRKLLEITARLASGELPPACVRVNLETQSWTAQVPQEPAPAPSDAIADVAPEATENITG
jgi:hypothetical protein